MSERLEVFDAADGYEICWVIDGDRGGALGDVVPGPDDDDEFHAAYKTAQSIAGKPPQPYQGFVFETFKQANQALRAVRTAIKAAKAERPMPDWATKALSEGWKPPRGWTP